MVRFNYIITIHNKQDLIGHVIKAVIDCCGKDSHIYPVIDGCTDGTEAIIDAIINDGPPVPVTKVYTPDVHELLSINAGLRAADQDGHGYNIVLQDDVVFADPQLEDKVVSLYEWAGAELGYLSFRLGANLTEDAAISAESVPLTDYIENAYGHALPGSGMLLPGNLAYRDVPIKSPVCFPFKLIQKVGILDERLAPYGHDDTDYAIRCIDAGFRNAVFGVRFYSELKWGGTRTTPHPHIAAILNRNMRQIREWHGSSLAHICHDREASQAVGVPGMRSERNEREAIEYRKRIMWGQRLRRLRNALSPTSVRRLPSSFIRTVNRVLRAES